MKSAIGIGLMLIALAGHGGANTMTRHQPVQCSIANAGKLPAELTADHICDAFRTAAVPALAGLGRSASDVSIVVTVLSNSRLAVSTTVSGELLPERRLAAADRSLNSAAIEMLARAVAGDIAAHLQSLGA